MSDHAFFALSLSASGQTVFFIVRSSLYRLDRKQNRCLHGGVWAPTMQHRGRDDVHRAHRSGCMELMM